MSITFAFDGLGIALACIVFIAIVGSVISFHDTMSKETKEKEKSEK